MRRQSYVLQRDSPNGRAQALGDGGARPFGRRSGGAVPTSEAHGSRQLLSESMDLLARLVSTPDVVELLRLREVFAQVLQAPAVRRLRSVVEQRVPGLGRQHIRQLWLALPGLRPPAHEVEDVEFLPGMSQQMCEVVKAPHVLQPADRPLVGQSPVVTFLAKRGALGCLENVVCPGRP